MLFPRLAEHNATLYHIMERHQAEILKKLKSIKFDLNHVNNKLELQRGKLLWELRETCPYGEWMNFVREHQHEIGEYRDVTRSINQHLSQ